MSTSYHKYPPRQQDKVLLILEHDKTRIKRRFTGDFRRKKVSEILANHEQELAQMQAEKRILKNTWF